MTKSLRSDVGSSPKEHFVHVEIWYTTFMNKLVPFSKFSKVGKNSAISSSSVIVDKNNIPLGFVFGRDSFISLCTIIDEEFEKRVKDPKIAYDNPAGRIIDLIEAKLPVNPKFKAELKDSIQSAKKTRWIPLDEVAAALHV